MATAVNVLGWVGTILILCAYLLLSRGILSPQDSTYHFMNLLGAVGVGVLVFYQGAWPALMLQIAWGGIAITTLFQIVFKLKHKKR